MSRLFALLTLIFSSIGSYGHNNTTPETTSNILASFTVYAGAYDRINTPVFANLSGIFLKTESYELQLVETTNGANREVASQVESSYQHSLWWVLDGKTPAGTKRHFELRHKTPSAASKKKVSLQDTGEAINIQVAGKNVLAYHYGLTPVPKGVDPLYSRGGYIHPLWSPEGEVLTRIQPEDHYHHYGIWNPWTKTEFQGREIDFWNLIKGEGTVKVKSVSSRVEGDVFASISAVHEHIDKKAAKGAQVALNEQWDIRVWNTDPENKIWLVDFTSTMSCATTSPLTIKEYRYEGFGFRANKAWDDKSATLLTSEGHDKSNGNGTRARWCDVKGPSKAGTSGVLFMTHPSNYNFPEKIRIWPVGMNKGKENVFFNFNPAQDRDWVLKPGKDYSLRYRMMVYDGEVDARTADVYWNDLAHPPHVAVRTFSQDKKQKRVLVYTKNGEGYVHENIPYSIAAIKKLGKENGFLVDASDDPGVFTDKNISRYDALIFSNTNNEVFDTQEQRDVFKRYIQSGGAFVGIHSACGSERSWPWFWKVLGGKFHRHPPRQDFDVKILDKDHPSTRFLPDTWHIKDDECYYMKHLNPDIHVLAAADLNTVKDDKKAEYPGEVFGDSFPTTWCHEFDGGRQWYTALGHKPEHYEDPLLLKHILGGIFWALEMK
ncbi:PmoA family protein [Fulvivirgaceae bacterium BMA12]|uniref:PmoA family protein n=1 Tax=Agaribacillus aureus TaxID=3051825 RepID=A0ABT8L1Z5_9BACT|nr:PmoA family protein [Fulvivirgaceae bacterium BMA12]